jgi:hypothetical protein
MVRSNLRFWQVSAVRRPVLKTGKGKLFVGSNPTPSAHQVERPALPARAALTARRREGARPRRLAPASVRVGGDAFEMVIWVTRGPG